MNRREFISSVKKTYEIKPILDQYNKNKQVEITLLYKAIHLPLKDFAEIQGIVIKKEDKQKINNLIELKNNLICHIAKENYSINNNVDVKTLLSLFINNKSIYEYVHE